MSQDSMNESPLAIIHKNVGSFLESNIGLKSLKPKITFSKSKEKTKDK